MKTLLLYNDFENPIRFLIVDGDYSRFNGVMINTDGNGFEDEFIDFTFDKVTGDFNHEWFYDISLVENKQWDKVAVCTWVP